MLGSHMDIYRLLQHALKHHTRQHASSSSPDHPIPPGPNQPRKLREDNERIQVVRVAHELLIENLRSREEANIVVNDRHSSLEPETRTNRISKHRILIDQRIEHISGAADMRFVSGEPEEGVWRIWRPIRDVDVHYCVWIESAKF